MHTSGTKPSTNRSCISYRSSKPPSSQPLTMGFPARRRMGQSTAPQLTGTEAALASDAQQSSRQALYTHTKMRTYKGSRTNMKPKHLPQQGSRLAAAGTGSWIKKKRHLEKTTQSSPRCGGIANLGLCQGKFTGTRMHSKRYNPSN